MEKTYRLITREEYINKYGNRKININTCNYDVSDIPETPVVFKMENLESRFDKDKDFEIYDENEERDGILSGYKRLYLPKEFIIEVKEDEKKMSTKNKVLIGSSVLSTIGIGYLINKFRN